VVQVVGKGLSVANEWCVAKLYVDYEGGKDTLNRGNPRHYRSILQTDAEDREKKEVGGDSGEKTLGMENMRVV